MNLYLDQFQLGKQSCRFCLSRAEAFSDENTGKQGEKTGFVQARSLYDPEGSLCHARCLCLSYAAVAVAYSVELGSLTFAPRPLRS